MKKNRVFIFLAFVCIIQLAVPLSIMGMKEIATENGLQGKMKVEAVFYSALSETLDFELSRYTEKDGSSGSYIPVYLDESLKRFDFVYPAAGSSNSAIKLTLEELEKYSNYVKWVDVTKLPE